MPFASRGTRALFLTPVVVGSLMLCVAAPAASQTVIQHGWEDGTLQGWAPFGGGVVLTNTTAAANSGARSLLTTRPHGGLQRAKPRASVRCSRRGRCTSSPRSSRLAPGEAATQVQDDDAADADGWQRGVRAGGVEHGGHRCRLGDGAGRLTASRAASRRCCSTSRARARRRPTTWTTSASASCRPPAAANRRIRRAFTPTSRPEPARAGGRASAARRSRSRTADAHSGTYSLLTTGRQAAFDGAAINAAGKLCNGSRYTVSVWVKLAPGRAEHADPGQPAADARGHDHVPHRHRQHDGHRRRSGCGSARPTTSCFNYQSLTLYVESASGTRVLPHRRLRSDVRPAAGGRARHRLGARGVRRTTSRSAPRSGRATWPASTRSSSRSTSTA